MGSLDDPACDAMIGLHAADRAGEGLARRYRLDIDAVAALPIRVDEPIGIRPARL